MQNWLKDFLIKKKTTLEEMASKLDISLSLLAKIYYGQRQPSRKFIEKFKQTYPEVDTNIFFS